ncbi:phosphopantetheine-binding protein, partial [Microbacterium sp. 18062]|uniref:phosphopantetheine-binding protein n=1 Tax=Microbacterium sp. 18062 TaxID=2681410 RepID=UPI001359299E
GGEGRQPETDTEKTLATIFHDVLHLTDDMTVSADDDFFHLGGDSILSMSLVRNAQRQGLKLTIQDVFTLRTPARLSAAMNAEDPKGSSALEDAAMAVEPQPITPLVNQHRLRLSDLTLEGHVLTEVVALPRPASLSQVRQAVRSLLRDVDGLRQRVTPTSRLLWTTEVEPYAEQLAEEYVSSHDRATLAIEHAASGLRAHVVERIDITAGRNLHVALVDSAEGPHVVVAAHGLAADRRSIHHLAERLVALVSGAGETPPQPSISTTSTTLADLAQSAESEAVLDEWADRLLALPLADNRSDAGRLAIRTVPVIWPADADRSAREIVEAAFVAAVGQWSDVERAIDLEWDLRSHLRSDDGEDELIGALTAVYPRLAGSDEAAPIPYAPWHDLWRYQNKTSRRRLRRAPTSDVLLTQFFGRKADPGSPEGFEPLYGVVAGYRIAPHGVDLQLRGVDPAGLLDHWTREIETHRPVLMTTES